MIPLIPLDTLSQYRSRDPIPFSCESCGDVFHRSKNIVCRAIKRTKSISCCSVKCAFEKKTADSIVVKDCPRCHKSFSRRKSDATTYCSQKCANVNGSSGQRTDQTKKRISHALKRRWRGKSDIYPATRIKHAVCPTCRKGFHHPHNRRRKFCGKTCYTHFFSEKCKATKGMCKNNNRHAGWYESPIAGRVWLESTWEVKVAKMLDANQVDWSRPKGGFPWIDSEGKPHRYYPDFYLPDYNLYLDPKNPYRQEQDAYKIEDVKRRYGLNLHVLSKVDLTFERIMQIALSVEAGG